MQHDSLLTFPQSPEVYQHFLSQLDQHVQERVEQLCVVKETLTPVHSRGWITAAAGGEEGFVS
jgi:hypothetical protein